MGFVKQSVMLVLLVAVVLQPLTSFTNETTIKVTVTNIQQNNAKLSWTPFLEATRYEISFGTDPDAANRKPFFSSQTLAFLPNLMPSTIYHVKVRPVLSGRAGNWSEIITFSTAVPHVQQIRIEEVGTAYAKFSWSARYQDLSDIFYDVAISDSDEEDSKPLKIESTNQNSITVQDLDPGKKYFIKFRLRNPLNNGPWSSTRIITTLPELPQAAPAKLKVESLTSQEVEVTWEKMANAMRYELAYTSDGQTTTTTATSSTSLTFTLPSNREFHFKVRAKTIGDQTQWSPWISHLTLPETVTTITVAAQTVEETIIQWSPPPGQKDELSYEVKWGTDVTASNLGSSPTAQTSMTIAGLKPDTQFNLRVRSINPTGPSRWSKFLVFRTLPKQLSNISVSDITNNSAMVRWPTVFRAVNYEVSYGSDLSASHHSLTELKTNSVNLKKLIPDVTYYIKVRPVLPNLVYGAWSKIISFQTYPIPGKPSKPQLVDVGTDQIKLMWQHAPNAKGYEILISKDQAIISGQPFTFSKTRGTIKPLASNQNYYFKLRAVNLGGKGEWSEPHQVTTAPAPAPQNVHISNITSYDAVIHWDPVTGNGDFTYTLRYATGQTNWEIIPDLKLSSYNLTDLLPNTNYTVQINTSNISGQTDWSDREQFRTLPAPPAQAPTGLREVGYSDVEVICTWHRMPKVSGYILSYGTDIDASNLGEVKTQRINYTYKNLVPQTGYYFKVRSYNQTGESPWSPTLYVYTKATPPITAPTRVTIIDTSEASITVNWDISYRLLHYETSIGTDPEAQNLGKPRIVPDPPYTFKNLNAGTTYYIKVRKVNKGGGGPWSRIFKVQTLDETSND